MERKELPNSTAVLVLGILSIVFCWCYGFLGLTMAIIALGLSSSPMKAWRENPDPLYWKGYDNLKAGRICAIIGLVLSGILILCYLLFFVIIGAAGFSDILENIYNYS